jgi:soluble lytic murein transglycosylase-like protein
LLFLGLLSVSTYAGWRIWGLTGEKETIDRRIRDIEAKLRSQNAAGDEADRLIAQLGAYEGEAEALRRSLLYRVGVREKDDFVTQEIRLLMAEFGAEVYSVPPDFADRVRVYIGQYQGSDRSLMARALTGAAPQFNTVRRILVENHLPPDLAYIPLVESALAPERASAAGAAGPWQFTPATAKAYGLSLGPPDERLHLASSTRAACRYMRELILEFGGGSSVMLALAAYNLGPTKVRQAVMDTVRDPIKQRNFWYLYRLRALPEETREYVPKTVAVMIIGRNPGRFGF